MCIHPLTVFTCGHILIQRPPLLPCPFATRTHTRSTPPCTIRGHPYTSHFVSRACAPCALEDERRARRIAEINSGLLLGVKVDEAKWKVAYGSLREEMPMRAIEGGGRRGRVGVGDVQWEGGAMEVEMREAWREGGGGGG